MAKRAASSAEAEHDATGSTAARVTNGATTGSHGLADAPKMTPAAALARHVEWLEYALGAAKAEETVRAGRVETAAKKNREKRTTRLAEVRDEIAELTALLAGIRDLQAKARVPRPRKPATPRARTTPSKATTTRRRAAGTTSGA